MLATLILGVFGIIAFTYSYTIIQIFISIQPLILFVLILFLAIHYKDFKPRYDKWINEEITILPNQSEINGFKKRFEQLSDSEIERKLNENLVNEAKEALRQIQNERA